MKTLAKKKPTKKLKVASPERSLASGVMYTIRGEPKLQLMQKRLREHPFTLSIINNNFTHPAYYTYLSNIIHIYAILEDKFLTLPMFKAKGIMLSEEYKFLFRTPRIFEDIMSYKALISPYIKHHNPRMYISSWLQNMRMRDPHLLVCEFYIRMLGDLHGSTALCSKLRFNQTYSFRDIPGKIDLVERFIGMACKEFQSFEVVAMMINSYSFHLNFLSSLQADFIDDKLD